MIKPQKVIRKVRHLFRIWNDSVLLLSMIKWNCEIVIVEEKDSEMRFCCDFRPLKNSTIKYANTFPSIDDSVSSLGIIQGFISIDPTTAFWQILVKKKDRLQVCLRL